MSILSEKITPKRFHQADGIDDWRVVGDGACAAFRTGSLARGAQFVQAISALSESGHQPDVDLRNDLTTVRLVTFRSA